jgi:hypothetical protein
MNNLWKRLGLGLGLAVLAGFLVLIGIYPLRPNSVLGWLILFGFALPIMVVFEYAGERLINPTFVGRFGYFGRIVYGVFVIGVFLVLSILAVKFFEPFLGKWDF